MSASAPSPAIASSPPPLPELPASLRPFAEPAPGLAIPTPTAADRVAARRVLPAYEAAARLAIDGAALADFLRPIVVACRNPPSREDFEAFVAVTVLAVEDFPRATLSRHTVKLALAQFQFWPATADVVQLLAPAARRFRAELATVRNLGATEPVDEEIDAEAKAYLQVFQDRVAALGRGRLPDLLAIAQAYPPVARRAIWRRWAPGP